MIRVALIHMFYSQTMSIDLSRIKRSLFITLGLVGCTTPEGPLMTGETGTEGISSDDAGSGEGNGSSGGSNDSGESSSSGGSTVTPIDCPNPTPIMQVGTDGSVPTGFVDCGNGIIHRESAEACLDKFVPSDEPIAACDVEGSTCQADTDCTDGVQGKCSFEQDACGCTYGCETDADCGEGQFCACAGDDSPSLIPDFQNVCVPINDCTIDVDCGENSFCGFSQALDACFAVYELGCFTPDDECRTDEDCDVGECVPGGSSDGAGWGCYVSEATCGRPFVVEGQVRRAETTARGDWVMTQGLTSTISASMREVLATHWETAGAMEHASVASFAQFAMDLMALGAPPQLLVDASQAMRDEVDHAQRCYALASRYRGHNVGPGPLDTSHPRTEQIDLEAFAEAVIVEGCIGETLAAIEAGHAARVSTDVAVKRALEVIAVDEERHAQLGWKTLQWILGEATPTQRERIEAILWRAIAHAERVRPWSPAYDAMSEHGVLGHQGAQALALQSLRQVVKPCAQALVA